MGADSTMDITKADALVEIMRCLLSASNEELVSTLYALVGHKQFYNFHIVENYSG